MAQLQNITIEAVGFAGLNTQDSPAAIEPSFASKAENCVIDKHGRIAARKGYVPINQAGSSDGNEKPTKALFRYVDSDGNEKYLSASDNKIFEGLGTTSDITPAGATITNDNWKIVQLQNHAYFFQRDHEPMVFTKEDGVYTLKLMSDATGVVGTVPLKAHEALSAYGRLWIADSSENKSTLYWSDTLNGRGWSGGTSGYVDLSTVFPAGFDEITALAAHNGFLVIFGKNSIVVYSGAASPSEMALADTVRNVGCIARDTVQFTGQDLIFLSSDGLRTLGRTIQEKSMPMGNLSRNVHSTFLADIRGSDADQMASVYSPEEGFYLLSMPDKQLVYCFSLQNILPDGAARVTTWYDSFSMSTPTNGIYPYAFCQCPTGLLMGRKNGIYKYGGFVDWDIYSGGVYYYIMEYLSNPMDFGQPSNLKFIKKFELVAVGNTWEDESGVVWYYDYDETAEFIGTYPAPALPSSAAQYEESNNTSQNEYEDVGTVGTTVFEYTDGSVVHTPTVQGRGSGQVLTAGVKVMVYGSPYSIQKLGIHATLGRLA